ncbi:hypothetical protein V6Z12_D02G279300 [Gossypium hirsutum]
MGLKAVSEGKLAVLLLSGGQGTRLGSSDPKGCFNVGLPSGKSLFQLQAERILCVQRLAAQAMNEGSVTIHWYIMTSPFTDDATGKFFESHKYFGLEADQVTFFQQGTTPCISKDGRYVMETPFKERDMDSNPITKLESLSWNTNSLIKWKTIRLPKHILRNTRMAMEEFVTVLGGLGIRDDCPKAFNKLTSLMKMGR